MENYFTIIPNKLFYTTDETETIYKEVGNYKILLMLDYLHTNTNRLGITKLSVEDIITTYGYKLDNHKGRINEQITNMLLYVKDKGIIDCKCDINKLTVKQLISCKYDGIEKDENGNYINFTIINYNVFSEILNYKKEKVDNIALLFYYCYLCSRIFTREGRYDVTNGGGRAEVCYPSYDTITKDTNLSAKTINKYNNILVGMNLIRIGNLGLYYIGDNKKDIKESPNFYALVKKEDLNVSDEKSTSWYINLKEGMKYYKDVVHENYTFLETREYKDNNKSNNGYIARINQLEKEGKATKKQINKRDKLISERENNDIQTK